MLGDTHCILLFVVLMRLIALNRFRPMAPAIAIKAISLFASNAMAVELVDTALAVDALIGAHMVIALTFGIKNFLFRNIISLQPTF